MCLALAFIMIDAIEILDLMENRFNIFGISQMDKDKSKCGDYFLFHILHDKFIVLALADGVGSRPCDWLASKTTCEKFIEIACEKIGNSFDANDLVHICNEVDKYVSNPPANCKGMMSTLVAVIWNTEDHFLHFVNVGDSRIYKISKDDQIVQISADDVKAVNVRDRNGKLILSGGYTITRSGLTNAFGLSNVKITPQLCEFNGGDTIILASDGFYNCSPDFDRDMLKVAHSINLTESVSHLIHRYRDYQNDDSTVLLLRNNTIQLDLPENKVLIDYSEIKDKMAKFQIIGLMYEKLKQCIIHKNQDLALATLTLMDTESILPSKMMLDEIIVLMKKENYTDSKILNGIVNLIRKGMK